MKGIARHPEWDLSASLAANMHNVLPALVSQYFALFRETCLGRPTAKDLHRLRLAGKRLRYYLELFRSHKFPGVDTVIGGLKQIQGELGRISDLDATEDLILAQGAPDDPGRAMLLRFIREERDRTVRSFLAKNGTADCPARIEATWRNLLAVAR